MGGIAPYCPDASGHHYRPKPMRKRAKKPLKRVMKDGRPILSGKAYNKLRAEKYEEQDGFCVRCHLPFVLSNMELRHTDSRGMSGGKRDDRKVQLLCKPCHQAVTPGPQFGRKS